MAKTEVTVDGITYDIPEGSDGYVPERALLKHFYTSGIVRKHGRDWDKDAKHVLPIKITPEQAAAWYEKPVRNDIEYIDARGKPHYNTDYIKDSRSKKVHDKIGVICVPSMEKRIRDLFDKSYTIEEQEKIVKKSPITITIRPIDTAFGRYMPFGKEIELDFLAGTTNSTLVHEAVHHLRMVDDERTNKVTKSPITSAFIPKLIRNIEESCTVAEQMARAENPNSGYYSDVMVFDKTKKRWRKPTDAEALRMMKEDRELFTGGTGKPLSGKAAIESVNKNWHKSHISRLKIKGSKAMAIKGMETMEPTIKQDKVYQATLMDAKRKAAKPAAKRATAKKSTAKTVKAKKGLLSRKKSAAKRATTKKATTKKPVKASCNSVALSSIRSKKQKSKMSTKKATTKKPAAKTATKKPAASGRYARPSRAR